MTAPVKRLRALDEEGFNVACEGMAVVVFGDEMSSRSKLQCSMVVNVEEVFGSNMAFGFVDVEKNPALRERFKIENVPVTMVIEKGVEIQRFTGLHRGKWLADFLNRQGKFYSSKTDFRKLWMERQDTDEEKTLRGKSILIIDDNPDTIFCIRSILENAGYEKIALYSRSADALESMRADKPDLIFLNLQMKDHEGHKVMKEIRRSNLKFIPLLVSVGPTKKGDVFEEVFEDASILKQGESVRQPRNSMSFLGLVRHMLQLEGAPLKDQPAIAVDSYCPLDTASK